MRVRVRFTKNGPIRFVSHRDVARIFERALRAAGVRVAYSEGFSPRPKISFGLALSVGFESDAEYLDVDVAAPVDLESFPGRLTAALPDGLTVEAASPVAPGTPSLQQAIVCCDWEFEVLNLTEAALARSVADLLEQRHVMLERERKGKQTTVDVRPALMSLNATGPTVDGVRLAATLSTDLVTIRPDEVVSLLGNDARLGRARRLKQWTMADGQRLEPLASAALREETIHVRDLGPPGSPAAQTAAAGR